MSPGFFEPTYNSNFLFKFSNIIAKFKNLITILHTKKCFTEVNKEKNEYQNISKFKVFIFLIFAFAYLFLQEILLKSIRP